MTKEELDEIKTKFPEYTGRTNSLLNDLTNQQFGQLTVLYRGENNLNSRRPYWICQCSCGKITRVIGANLTQKLTISCGCYKANLLRSKNMNKRKIDLTGQKFGYVTALESTEKRSGGHIVWKCQCICGNIIYVDSASLQRCSNIYSCGCKRQSTNEKIIEGLLLQNNILFEKQKIFKNCLFPNNQYARFDFYVNNQYIIEYDGQQHFKYTNYGWFTKERRDHDYQNDLIKNKYCFDNNIPLIRIPYDEKYTIDDLKLKTTKFLLTSKNEYKYYESRKMI